MKKLLLITLLSGIMLSSGCVSYLAYRDNEKQFELHNARKVAAIQNLYTKEAANDIVKAVDLGAGAAGVGFNVLAINKLNELEGPNKLKVIAKQAGAAILDAGLMYGLYAGIESISSSSSDNRVVDVSGDNNTIIINTGDNDTGTVDQHESNETN